MISVYAVNVKLPTPCAVARTGTFSTGDTKIISSSVNTIGTDTCCVYTPLDATQLLLDKTTTVLFTLLTPSKAVTRVSSSSTNPTMLSASEPSIDLYTTNDTAVPITSNALFNVTS